MQHREGRFDGVLNRKIYWQAWLPEGDPKATLVVAHGYAEHSGRYGNLVDYFVPKGYAIYALDHHGHGKSEGERVKVEDHHDFIRDLKLFFDFVQEEQPSGAHFLVGHSMGGGIAIAYTIEHQDEFDGVVISGSGILKPGAERSPRPLGVELADTLSRDPQVAEHYRNDPLVYMGPRPEATMQAMAAAGQRNADRAHEITIPILVMVGDASPLGEGPRGQDLHDTVSSEVKRIHHYPDLLHEIFNEPEHGEVMADMEQWLEELIAG